MALARTTDPETSHEAAQSVGDTTETQQRILDIFYDFPLGLTDHELQALYRHRSERSTKYPLASESGIRSRRSELVAAGKLEDSGSRNKLPSGRKAIVWRIAR